MPEAFPPLGSSQVIISLAPGLLQGLPHLALQHMHILGMCGLCFRQPRLPLALHLPKLQRCSLTRLLQSAWQLLQVVWQTKRRPVP